MTLHVLESMQACHGAIFTPTNHIGCIYGSSVVGLCMPCVWSGGINYLSSPGNHLYIV